MKTIRLCLILALAAAFMLPTTIFAEDLADKAIKVWQLVKDAEKAEAAEEQEAHGREQRPLWQDQEERHRPDGYEDDAEQAHRQESIDRVG